jgi:hypothetical protein
VESLLDLVAEASAFDNDHLRRVFGETLPETLAMNAHITDETAARIETLCPSTAVRTRLIANDAVSDAFTAGLLEDALAVIEAAETIEDEAPDAPRSIAAHKARALEAAQVVYAGLVSRAPSPEFLARVQSLRTLDTMERDAAFFKAAYLSMEERLDAARRVLSRDAADEVEDAIASRVLYDIVRGGAPVAFLRETMKTHPELFTSHELRYWFERWTHEVGNPEGLLIAVAHPGAAAEPLDASVYEEIALAMKSLAERYARQYDADVKIVEARSQTADAVARIDALKKLHAMRNDASKAVEIEQELRALLRDTSQTVEKPASERETAALLQNLIDRLHALRDSGTPSEKTVARAIANGPVAREARVFIATARAEEVPAPTHQPTTARTRTRF